eukprot:3442508-Rhodomonas_salina.1
MSGTDLGYAATRLEIISAGTGGITWQRRPRVTLWRARVLSPTHTTLYVQQTQCAPRTVHSSSSTCTSQYTLTHPTTRALRSHRHSPASSVQFGPEPVLYGVPDTRCPVLTSAMLLPGRNAATTVRVAGGRGAEGNRDSATILEIVS